MKKIFLFAFSTCLSWNTLMAQTGEALNFDGSDDYVDLGNPLADQSSYTKEAWIYATNLTGAKNIVSSYDNPFWISDGILYAGNNGSFAVVGDMTQFPVNAWVHVAVTFDAATTTMRLYKNGVLVSENTSAPQYLMRQHEFIGSHNMSSIFSGSMDEVRLWNRALTVVEINRSKNCGVEGSRPGLVANYHFNQGEADADNTSLTQLNDATEKENHGTLVNFALTGETSNWTAPGSNTVDRSNTGTDEQTACRSFKWIDGLTYQENNNTATYTLTNVAGCDSVVTLQLNLIHLDTTTSTEGNLITANQADVSYQWVDCKQNYRILENETNRRLEASIGSYAVILTLESCVDTSQCVDISVTGTEDNTLQENIQLYPNPTSGALSVELSSISSIASYILTSTDGRVIAQGKIVEPRFTLDLGEAPKGMYFLTVNKDGMASHHKIIRE